MSHVFRVSQAMRHTFNSSGNRMIDEIIASGRFTSRDAAAFRKMHTDTIRALHKKFAGLKPPHDDEDEEFEDVKTDKYDEEVKGMANMHRMGKALERQNERTAMAERMSQPKYFQVANGVHDDEAEGMVPPSLSDAYRKR